MKPEPDFHHLQCFVFSVTRSYTLHLPLDSPCQPSAVSYEARSSRKNVLGCNIYQCKCDCLSRGKILGDPMDEGQRRIRGPSSLLRKSTTIVCWRLEACPVELEVFNMQHLEYRKKVESPVTWCHDDNLSFNVSKTKEELWTQLSPSWKPACPPWTLPTLPTASGKQPA
ncbi:uncharacterized protein LOC134353936 isoform X3 [Mobula hypostoma]|uniref:uncharacterized protein LOC134353936 isoform X3 n=1 Tax=Mobula hypostoma TaxID=723540 RepID=UPI002FC38E24